MSNYSELWMNSRVVRMTIAIDAHETLWNGCPVMWSLLLKQSQTLVFIIVALISCLHVSLINERGD